MEQKYIVAFEIGSSCIKGAVATTTPGDPGRINILAVESEQLIDKVRYGCVENPGDVAACVTNICHRLQAAPGITPRVIKEAYVGISGRSLCSIPHEVSRDFHAEVEITKRHIEELMAHAATKIVPDKEIVTVEPGSFTLDSSSSLDPVGIFGHVLSANVSLVVCKPKIKNNIKRVFNDRCALNIAGFIVTPLAMGANMLTVEERRLGVMLVDFGAETTTVSIYREGALVYLATLPMGSRNITRDLTSLNCLEERAEEIKKAVGNAMPPLSDATPLVTDGLDNSAINNIVAARADEIISNIFEQIKFADLKPEQLHAGIVVTGGGARLRGFDDLLSKQTRMKTRPATLPSQVSITGNGFNPNEALDVISILCDAAFLGAQECTLMPPHVLDNTTGTTPDSSRPDTDTHASQHDDASRIGYIDNDDSDDDDVMSDDFDPNDLDQDNTSLHHKLEQMKNKQNHKEGNRKKDNEKNKDATPDDSSSSNFWIKVANRLTNLMKEDKEFES